MCSKIDEKETTLAVSAPEFIQAHHDLSKFDCGQDTLNYFLKHQALKNAKNQATTTYVVCYQGTDTVAGYFSLASGKVLREDVPKNMQRNMPNDIPVVVLARLAVDKPLQGDGLGEELLAESVDRALLAAEHVAVRALMVNALDESLVGFYKKNGFVETLNDPLALLFSLKTRG